MVAANNNKTGDIAKLVEDGLRLLEAFRKIRDPAVRQRIIEDAERASLAQDGN